MTPERKNPTLVYVIADYGDLHDLAFADTTGHSRGQRR